MATAFVDVMQMHTIAGEEIFSSARAAAIRQTRIAARRTNRIIMLMWRRIE